MARKAKRHVFFLDDEPEVRKVVMETLQESGVKVTCFASPAACLAQLHSQTCDLLITDLKMPEKSGMELLADVKRFVPWVPVLMITGYGDVPTAVKAIKSGAVDFIEKPLAKRSFVRKVKSILRRGAPGGARPSKPLTAAEASVLRLVIEGKGNREIANSLNRSIRTIEAHRAHLMQKLGVDNVVDLVKTGAAMGLVELETKPPDDTKPDAEDKA